MVPETRATTEVKGPRVPFSVSAFPPIARARPAMASAKRKQDERNLKTLREFVSQPGNKECFDCNQRGPTYVNMTIGSFVCTSCSGML